MLYRWSATEVRIDRLITLLQFSAMSVYSVKNGSDTPELITVDLDNKEFLSSLVAYKQLKFLVDFHWAYSALYYIDVFS